LVGNRNPEEAHASLFLSVFDDFKFLFHVFPFVLV
jgi:hypothetical protein